MDSLVRRSSTTIKPSPEETPLPLAARVLMRRFQLTPGMARAIAAAAGLNIEVE